MAFVSTNTEIALLDTRTQGGPLILPSTNQPFGGRILLFKDPYGTFSKFPANIYTTGIDTTVLPGVALIDTFEDGSTLNSLSNNFAFQQFYTASTTKWYTIGGSGLNAFRGNVGTFSSLQGFSTINLPISTGTVPLLSLSTLSTSYVSTLNARFSSLSTVRFTTNFTSSLFLQTLLGVNRFAALNLGVNTLTLSRLFVNRAFHSTFQTSTMRVQQTVSSITLFTKLLSSTYINISSVSITSSLAAFTTSTSAVLVPTVQGSFLSTPTLSSPTSVGFAQIDNLVNRSTTLSILSANVVSTLLLSTPTLFTSSISTLNFRAGTGTVSTLAYVFASSLVYTTSSLYVDFLLTRRFIPLLTPFVTYFATGTIQTFTVPSGASRINVYMWGAGGTNQGNAPGSTGGGGAFMSGTIAVTPGQVYYIIVGQQTNGGATSLATGGGGGSGITGGGFTGIFSGSPATGNVIAIAGGGGGGGTNGGGVGGGGGYPNGGDGSSTQAVTFGTGGTQVSGGTGVVAGTQLQGGGNFGGGCGGGGWWGGGAGANFLSSAGGGGGSSTYTGTFTNVVSINGPSGTLPGTTIPTSAANETSIFYTAPYGRSGYNGYLLIQLELDPQSLYIDSVTALDRVTALTFASFSTVSSGRFLLSTLQSLQTVNANVISSITTTVPTFSTFSTFVSSTALSSPIVSTLNSRALSSGVAYISTLSTINFFQSLSNVTNFQVTNFSTTRFTASYLALSSLSTTTFSATLGFNSSLSVFNFSTTQRAFISGFTADVVRISTLILSSLSTKNISTLVSFTTSNAFFTSFSINSLTIPNAFISGIQTNFFFQSTFTIPFLSNVPFSANRISSSSATIPSTFFTNSIAAQARYVNMSTTNLYTSTVNLSTFSTLELSTFAFARADDLEASTATVIYFSSLLTSLSSFVAQRITTQLFTTTDPLKSLDSISTGTFFLTAATVSTFGLSNLSSPIGFFSTLSTQLLITKSTFTTSLVSSLTFVTLFLNSSSVTNIQYPFVSSVYQIPLTGLSPSTVTVTNAFDSMSSIGLNRLNTNIGFISTLSSVATSAVSMNAFFISGTTLSTAINTGTNRLLTSNLFQSRYVLSTFAPPVDIIQDYQIGNPTAFVGTGTIQTYTVPTGVTTLKFAIWGAGGSGQNGVASALSGSGGYVEGIITVNPGDILYIIVGICGGSVALANGGPGTGLNGCGGGGFSGIFSGSPAVNTVIAIAGGGAGAGTNGGGYGGAGGYPNGSDGSTTQGITFGRGGTQTAGGAGAGSGVQFQGGSGAGGGGGGWYGGGAGASFLSAAGGGGGSSTYIASVQRVVTLSGTYNSVIQAPYETQPNYIAPYGRQQQNGLVVIGPLNIVNVSTPAVTTTSFFTSFGNFSTLSSISFNTRTTELNLQTLRVGGFLRYSTISTGAVISATSTLTSTISSGFLFTSTLLAPVFSATFGSLSSLSSLSNVLLTSYISSISSPLARVNIQLTTNSTVASTLFISSFSSLYTFGQSLFGNTRTSTFTYAASSMQSIRGITSSFAVSSINNLPPSFRYTDISTFTFSTGRFNLSSISFLNFTSTSLTAPLWIASGSDTTNTNRIKYSVDGINWTNSGYAFGGSYGNAVIFDGNFFYIGAASSGGSSARTKDGINYQVINMQIGYNVCGLAWNRMMYVAVGEELSVVPKFTYSYDGVNWLVGSAGTSAVGRGVAWGNNLWVATANGTTAASHIKWSVDGINWSDSLSGSVAEKDGVAYNGNLWIVSGAGTTQTDRIQYSIDGKNWSNIIRGGFSGNGGGTFGPGNNKVCWNGKMWVVVGSDSVANNTIQYSFDGSNFFPANSGGFLGQGNGVAWNGTMWVATGTDTGNNNLKYSYDGSNWSNGNNGTFTSGGWSIGFSSNQVPTFLGASTFQIQPNAIENVLYKTNKVGFTTSTIILNDLLSIDQTGTVGLKAPGLRSLDVGGIGRFSTLSTFQLTTSTILMTRYLEGQPAFINAMTSLSVSSMQLGSAPTGSTFGPSLSNIRLGLFQGDAYKPTGTTWNITSDERMKDNIVDATLDWCYNDMKQLRLRRFTYTSSFMNLVSLQDRNTLGFIAQEVEPIVPKAVTKGEAFGYSDFYTFSMDQIAMIQYGALQKTILDTEAIESTTLSLLTLNNDITVRLSTLEAYFYS